jgi:hypothetical protein
MTAVIAMENDKLSFSMAPDASGTIVDKSTGARWEIDSLARQERGELMEDVCWLRNDRCWVDYYPGTFDVEKLSEDTVRITLKGRLEKPVGRFTLQLALEGQDVIFRLRDIDESIPSLVYPPALLSDSVVVPTGIGQWFRKPYPGTRFYPQAGALHMRFFGGLKADADRGWIAIFEDGYADSGLYLSQMNASPAWVTSHGKWTPRSIRYSFTTGGYVGIAKRFRRYAKDNGLFRSLEEKIAENPRVGWLKGGRIVSCFMAYTNLYHHPLEPIHPYPVDKSIPEGKVVVQTSHADVARIIADARDLGMTRGVFNLRGWMHGGYDWSHPHVWPPEPALGSLDELKANMNPDGEFITVLHDNYQDSYARTEGFPEGVMQTREGELLFGGYWHGGQSYVMNPRQAVANATGNWEKIKQLEPRGCFIDTATCVQFYQDFHPEHPLTRSEDNQAKLDLLKLYKDDGMVMGSEEVSDFGVNRVDWFENRHVHETGVSIPLWPLVYHDAVYCGRYAGGTDAVEAAREIEDALWGYMTLWPAGTMDNWNARREQFAHSLKVDAAHALTGTDEMVTHRYLTGDELVEQTEFSSGISVMANFSDEPRSVDGKQIPAQDFIVLK